AHAPLAQLVEQQVGPDAQLLAAPLGREVDLKAGQPAALQQDAPQGSGRGPGPPATPPTLPVGPASVVPIPGGDRATSPDDQPAWLTPSSSLVLESVSGSRRSLSPARRRRGRGGGAPGPRGGRLLVLLDDLDLALDQLDLLLDDLDLALD